MSSLSRDPQKPLIDCTRSLLLRKFRRQNSSVPARATLLDRTISGNVSCLALHCDAAWNNVVATFYHELNEARSDPDVEEVINGGPVSLLGSNSRQGEECGDFPVFEANPLTKVFQEVPVGGGGTAPVQFQYSNFVHDPEGPAAALPHPPAKPRGARRSTV
jgi:hypothetical protein